MISRLLTLTCGGCSATQCSVSAKSSGFSAAACLTLPDSAWGCGACDEDRMAVTYDQSIVDKALDQHHLVAFCEVEGLQVATEQQLAELRNVVSGIRGLDPGPVRLAREPGAIDRKSVV